MTIIKNKIVRTLAATTLMIGASTSMAWANCGDDAPNNRYAPGSEHRDKAQIQKAKLQAPGSSDCIDKDDIGGSAASNEYFYTSNNNNNVNFLMEGFSNRSELRVEHNDFNIYDRASVSAKGRIFSQSDDLTLVTIMQIHVDNTNQDGPLAALKWSKEDLRKAGDDNSDPKSTGLFLTVRQSMDCNSNDDLCTTNILIDDDIDMTVFHRYILGVYEGELQLKVDGVVQSLTYDNIFENRDERLTSDTIDLTGSDWDYDDRELYFKIGTYLNSPGSAQTQFRRIKFNRTLVD